MTQVQFYHLKTTSIEAVLFFTVRLVEKIFDAKQTVCILAHTPNLLEPLDGLLWTALPRRFLAHDLLTTNTVSTSPICLALPTTQPPHAQVVINLSEDLPSHRPLRIIELLWEQELVKQKARKRYSAYQQQKLPLQYLELNQ